MTVSNSDTSAANSWMIVTDKLVGMWKETVVAYFTFMWPCIETNFFVIKPTRCTNTQIYFSVNLYIFRALPVPIFRSLFTLHSALVYTIYTIQHIPMLSVQ